MLFLSSEGWNEKSKLVDVMVERRDGAGQMHGNWVR
jgi:hypothetical protein